MKKTCKHLGRLMVAAAGFALALPAFGATAASKNGVTWTFNGNYTTGQYANGDPWVVGPVTITAIFPAPSDGRNGTMVNPPIGSAQGFDKDLSYNPYNSSLNVGKSLPLTVAANSSVVSSVTADAYTQYNTIQMVSILTVVSSAPPAGSFRPPAIGSGSRASQWNESQIDYSKLNTLARAPLTAAPALSSYVDWFSYPWFEVDSNWSGRYLHPSYMAPTGYGRDLAIRTGDAALLLNLDYTNAQKRDLLIGVIQAGIDTYGFVSKGGVFYADGGHNIGRLAPLVVAAGVLNDSQMKGVIAGSGMKFQEYQQTFFVSQSDVNLTARVMNNNYPVTQYTAANIGMPEWGIRHFSNPEKDNNAWGTPYRDSGGCAFIAVTMAARVMGLRNVIAWEPLFQYAERRLNYEQSGSYGGELNYNPTPAFHKQFYNNYKNATLGSGGEPANPPPLETTFGVGDRIQLSAQTNVRETGALTGTLLGTQPANTTGTIIGGPIGPDADAITWWQINFDTGVDGWTGHHNLLKTTSVAPSKPTGVHRVE